jgi:hypothetical protein
VVIVELWQRTVSVTVYTGAAQGRCIVTVFIAGTVPNRHDVASSQRICAGGRTEDTSVAKARAMKAEEYILKVGSVQLTISDQNGER